MSTAMPLTPPPPHPYPAYKPSGVDWLGVVPEHWAVERLSTSVESQINGVWGSDPDGTGDLPCIRVADFDRRNHRIRTDKLTLRSVKPNERSGRILRKGDLLLEKSGGGEQQPVGAVMLYDHHFQAVCSNFVGRMVLRESYDPTYQTYLHATLYALGVNKRSIKQTTGIQNIDASSYLSELVGVPPLPEQHAIVRYLDHVGRRIRRYVSAKRKLIALLEEEKQAVVNRAVTRGLDPNVCLKPAGVEWLGDVPRHWERRRLKTVLRPVDRRSTSGSETPLSLRREHGVVVYADHFKRPPQSRSLVGFKLVSAGQLVVNRLQANNGLIFNSAVDGLVSPDYSVFEGRSPIDMKFLSDLLRTSSYRAYFRQNATGLGTGTAGFLRLYDDTLLETPVYLPHVEEQSAIVEHLDIAIDDKDAAIARARRQIELVQEYRTRLIADVVTGKLDVREAAARLPDEDDEAEPIAESVLQIHGLDEDLCDADNLEEESAIEREVRA